MSQCLSTRPGQVQSEAHLLLSSVYFVDLVERQPEQLHPSLPG
jgi:hypothetical protein